jgi:fluoroquinolone resistance protein
MQMNDAELVERWEPLLVETLNADIARAVKQRRPFPRSVFGKTSEGREDFRGFTLREGIERMVLADYDFYLLRCDWAGCFVYTKVQRSRLDRMKIDGRIVGSGFEECSFRLASLVSSSLQGTFRGCDFSKANLSKAKGRETRFVDCSFADANLKQALLMHCFFENCTFEGTKFHNGSLAGSTFKRLDPSAVLWDNTIMEHVKFLPAENVSSTG